MNAPAFNIDRDRTDAAYRHSISIHCSVADEMEMAARCDLAELRDKASLGMSRGTDAAANVLAEVCRIATAHVYAQVPTSRLIRVLSTLRFTMEAARHLDRLERDG